MANTSMRELEEGMRRIQEVPEKGYFIGPRAPALVEAAEKALALPFPPSYKRFLSELGCGDVAGAEFYGLIDDNFTNGSVPNGIWLTQKLRKTSGLPNSLIVVSDTGDGGYYAIDTSEKSLDGENPVIIWYPSLSSSQSSCHKSADSFGAFFFHRITEALKG